MTAFNPDVNALLLELGYDVDRFPALEGFPECDQYADGTEAIMIDAHGRVIARYTYAEDVQS